MESTPGVATRTPQQLNLPDVKAHTIGTIVCQPQAGGQCVIMFNLPQLRDKRGLLR